MNSLRLLPSRVNHASRASAPSWSSPRCLQSRSRSAAFGSRWASTKNDGIDSVAKSPASKIPRQQSETQSATPPTPSPAEVVELLTTTGILPPLVLYRSILRAHRKKLDLRRRVLGDEYVKSEFRAHSQVENPLHIVGFLTAWQSYLAALEGETWRQGKLDEEKLKRLSDEQVAQLYELMKAAREA